MQNVKLDNKDCCGCTACYSICTRNAIIMVEDGKGFKYPQINEKLCNKCGLCKKVCNFDIFKSNEKNIKCYAVKHKDENEIVSSRSGAVFIALAELVLKQNGVVFGVEFDTVNHIIHKQENDKSGVNKFKGSKYVQSDMKECFSECERLLIEGKKVLFSGTACQIDGLLSFMRIKKVDISNLITVDIICHGVPSPKVWQVYLTHLNRKKEPLTLVDMRDKSIGWHQYGMKIASASHHLYVGKAVKNTYSKGFLADLYLRPSCHHCPARSGRSQSDFTLGDFWGIRRFYPAFDDNQGVGLVFVYSEQAMNLYKDLDVLQIEATYGQAILDNPCIEHNALQTSFREEFWKRFPKEGIPVIDKLCRKKKKPIGYRIINRLYKWIRT